MWREIDQVHDIIYYLDKLDSFTLWGETEEIIPKELHNEIMDKVTEWKDKILDNFDKYFVKRANLEVIRRTSEKIKNG